MIKREKERKREREGGREMRKYKQINKNKQLLEIMIIYIEPERNQKRERLLD